MIRYVLRCSDDHKFEAWFRSQAEYERQMELNPSLCPVCELAALQSAADWRADSIAQHPVSRPRGRQIAGLLKH